MLLYSRNNLATRLVNLTTIFIHGIIMLLVAVLTSHCPSQ